MQMKRMCDESFDPDRHGEEVSDQGAELPDRGQDGASHPHRRPRKVEADDRCLGARRFGLYWRERMSRSTGVTRVGQPGEATARSPHRPPVRPSLRAPSKGE